MKMRIPAIGASIILAAAWATWGFYACRPENFGWVGTFGDSFGGFNALVSGFSTLLVAVTLYLQVKQSRDQATEAHATLKRLEASLEQQVLNGEAMQKQLKIMALNSRIAIITSLLDLEVAKKVPSNNPHHRIANRGQDFKIAELTKELTEQKEMLMNF